MKDLYELKKMLCESLEEYGRQRELTSSSLQMIDTLAHACKNVCKIIESCENEEMGGLSREGYSSRRSYEGGSNYGGSYGYGSYEGGMSSRRGRGANGRFVSRDASEMSRRLREMMEEAPDDRTRQEIQKLADRIEQM